MESKRIRFGFVCGNANPVTSDALASVRVRSMEGALCESKQYVVFTVEKPMKACDVLKALEVFNANTGEETAVALEKFKDSDDMIVTFEKGQRFLQHPFYVVIREAKKVPIAEGESPIVWEWTVDGIPESMRHKRVAGELLSDLVDDSIFPSSQKRERNSKVSEEIKTARMLTKQQKMKSKQSLPPSTSGSIRSKGLSLSMQTGISPFEVKIFSMANEVTKSKDETIASKNYTIKLLETMLEDRKACVCTNQIEKPL